MTRGWSIVSAERLRAYAREAQQLLTFAERRKLTPFGAALAGVALIRNAIANMGGDPAWWCKLITSTKENPLEEFEVGKEPPVMSVRDDDVPELPIIPTEGRTCERCGVALAADHWAVYCTNECALAEAVGPERAAEWIVELGTVIDAAHKEPSAESLAEMPELGDEWFRNARRGGAHSKIHPPWTDEQVAALNRYQHAGRMHPFTGERHADGGECILIATRDGWTKCDGGPVIQRWAWRFMADD